MLLSSGDEWDHSLTFSESTTVRLHGPSRVEISYTSVDHSTSNIPNYGDRTYTPHVALTAFNDSDEAQDYRITFRVLRAGKELKPESSTVTIRAVQPDSKGLGRYEISKKDWDPGLVDDATGETGAESETYIDSLPGKTSPSRSYRSRRRSTTRFLIARDSQVAVRCRRTPPQEPHSVLRSRRLARIGAPFDQGGGLRHRGSA